MDVLNMGKKYISVTENPATGEPQTTMYAAEAGLPPVYKIRIIDGEYKTTTQFNNAYNEWIFNDDTEVYYAELEFWGAGLDEFIDKLRKIRETEK